MSVKPIDYDVPENIEVDEMDPEVSESTEDAQINVDVSNTFDINEVLDVLDIPEEPEFYDAIGKQEKVRDFYKHLIDNGYPIDKNALIEHKAYFKINADKELFVKYNKKKIKLTWENHSDKFLLPGTIASNYNKVNPGKKGAIFVRNVLGIGDRVKMPQSIQDQVIRLKQSLPKADKIDNSTLKELISFIDEINKKYAGLKAEIKTGPEKQDIGVDTNDLYNQNIRDMKRANKFLNSIRGSITVCTNKISNYDEQLAQLEAERGRVSFNREDGVEINEEKLREINKQIEELREQREFQYKYLNQKLKPGMKSQVESIRGTINTMLYFDRTFGERVRTLFREQAILVITTLVSIASTITAIGASIALGIKNATPNPKPKPDPKPDPPDPTPGPTPGPTTEPTPGSKN